MEPIKPLSILAVVLCISLHSYAQPAKYTTTINSAGGSNDINGNNYEWSVGEMAVINTGVASNIIVTQGVLQPATSSVDISEYESIKDHVSIYPVPSKSVVTLNYDFRNAGKLDIDISDITGRVVLSKTVSIAAAGTIPISLEHLANANYMLRIHYSSNTGSQSATTFKLNKIN